MDIPADRERRSGRRPDDAELEGLVRVIADDLDVERVRTAVATFVLKNSELIRAAARSKLTLAARTVHDSEDVLASVVRRMDRLTLEGRLKPIEGGDLWAFIMVIACNCAIDKTKLMAHAKKLLTDDGFLAYQFMARFDACACNEEATILVQRMIAALPNSQDRQVLDLLLRGASLNAAAGVLRISAAACRQRWMSIRLKLRDWFEEEASRIARSKRVSR